MLKNKRKKKDPAYDVVLISKEITKFFDKQTPEGRSVRNYFGVYVFYDYDDEPIYVGQTREGLGARVGRHLTNRRTDPVAMNVLDPFEVASIEVYPSHHPEEWDKNDKLLKDQLDQLEFSVFQKVLHDSKLRVVLNEKEIRKTKKVKLPRSYKERIVPDELFALRIHADIRIARRAGTIARLAQVISERDVTAGLRKVLLNQAMRLELLARQRFSEFEEDVPIAEPGEETGETVE